jgi:hypothetical protein
MKKIEGRHHSETDVERRVQVAFSVGEEKVQKLLPPIWRSAPLQAGPTRGANVFVAFRNRLFTAYHNADGTTSPGELDRGIILLAMARHAESGETGFWVMRPLSTNPRGIPGPYKNGKGASVRMEQRMETRESQDGTCVEDWHISLDEGELSMFLKYRYGEPSTGLGEMTVRGGPDLDFSRVYRTDTGTVIARSIPDAIDRVEHFSFKSSLEEFSSVFDGRENLVGIVIQPWYVRQVFLRD